MAAERDLELLQDRALADSARRGSRPAFDELYRRHALASWRLALAVTRQPAPAGQAVTAAFAATLARPGDAADDAGERLRLTLLRATRRAAADAAGQRSAAPLAHGPLGLEPGERRVALVRQAFDTLPERWRSALWLIDVEGCSAYDAAQVLELPPGAVTPLIQRARLGLREQVLYAGLERPSPLHCRRTTDRLTGYVDGALERRDETRVRSHLDECAACRERLAALDDLVPVLSRATLPLPIALVDEAVPRWSGSLVRALGPLHLGLPGGQPMPAWAERAFAGAVAAVIAMGITGATIVASRGRGGSGPDATRPVAAAGESALADPALSDLMFGGAGFVPPAGSAIGSASATAAKRPASSGAPLPRAYGPPADPVARSFAPAPTLPPTGSTPPPQPPPPPTPPPADDAVATVAVGDVAGVTVGDDCSGGQVAGTAMGCPPPVSDEPLTVEGTAVPSVPVGP